MQVLRRGGRFGLGQTSIAGRVRKMTMPVQSKTHCLLPASASLQKFCSEEPPPLAVSLVIPKQAYAGMQLYNRQHPGTIPQNQAHDVPTLYLKGNHSARRTGALLAL